MIKVLRLLFLLTICLCQDAPVARFLQGNMNLLPRQRAPFFSAIAVNPDLKFKKISLLDYQGKYVVWLFYPFDFTYVCPTELVAFSNAADQFRVLGAEVLGISTDSHFTHLAWLKTPRNQAGVDDIYRFHCWQIFLRRYRKHMVVQQKMNQMNYMELHQEDCLLSIVKTYQKQCKQAMLLLEDQQRKH